MSFDTGEELLDGLATFPFIMIHLSRVDAGRVKIEPQQQTSGEQSYPR